MKEIFKNVSFASANQYCPFCKKECICTHGIYTIIKCIDCHWIYNKYTFCIVNKNYKLSLIFNDNNINKICVNLNVIRGIFTPSYYYLHENILEESNNCNYSECRSYLIDYYLNYSDNLIFM